MMASLVVAPAPFVSGTVVCLGPGHLEEMESLEKVVTALAAPVMLGEVAKAMVALVLMEMASLEKAETALVALASREQAGMELAVALASREKAATAMVVALASGEKAGTAMVVLVLTEMDEWVRVVLAPR